MLDHVYAGVAGARRRWYERHPEARRRLKRPVISVGNLSVGGTGKTPLVAQIAEWLIARGERPAILSRGYKRPVTDDGVTVVSDGRTVLANFEHAGDEPLLMARQVPRAIVCVAEDRHMAGVVAERVLGATVHVLDDGFQHLQLARDFDILVTSLGEIPDGRVLPFGRLREASVAAARAHFVVVLGADTDRARTEAWELGIAEFSSATRRLDLGGASTFGHSGVIAAAAIGAPEQFYQMLRAAGFDLRETISFPDHHQFRAADLARIQSALTQANAKLVVTTAKDLVRFNAAGHVPFEVIAIPMRLDLEDWDALTASLEHVLTRTRSAAA